MFSTTLRLDDDLASFLQDAARQSALSVNGFLTELLNREREAAARRRLAEDWAAYAQEPAAQEVGYALAAQASLVAEPKRRSYRARKPK